MEGAVGFSCDCGSESWESSVTKTCLLLGQPPLGQKVALDWGFHSFDGSCFSEYLAHRVVPSIEILPSFRSASNVRFIL
jgi:hypothetical protein